MHTVSSRPYLPDLGRWRPLVIVVAALLAGLVLLAFVGAILAGAADSPPTDQLLAPFRWGPGSRAGA
jgi:hypothetical protein